MRPSVSPHCRTDWFSSTLHHCHIDNERMLIVTQLCCHHRVTFLHNWHFCSVRGQLWADIHHGSQASWCPFSLFPSVRNQGRSNLSTFFLVPCVIAVPYPVMLDYILLQYYSRWRLAAREKRIDYNYIQDRIKKRHSTCTSYRTLLYISDFPENPHPREWFSIDFLLALHPCPTVLPYTLASSILSFYWRGYFLFQETTHHYKSV